MQSLYSADPEKIIIGMVGCTLLLTQYLPEASPILAKKFTGISIGLALIRKCSTLEITDVNI